MNKNYSLSSQHLFLQSKSEMKSIRPHFFRFFLKGEPSLNLSFSKINPFMYWHGKKDDFQLECSLVGLEIQEGKEQRKHHFHFLFHSYDGVGFLRRCLGGGKWRYLPPPPPCLPPLRRNLGQNSGFCSKIER